MNTALQTFTERLQRIQQEFLQIRGDIPENFKRQFANAQISMKTEQTQNQLTRNAEQTTLTLKSLLQEIGKSDEYISVSASKIVRRLRDAGYDFLNPLNCSKFATGTNRKQTVVNFTPAGYLLAICTMTNAFAGREFRSKYLRFMADSAVLVARIDLIMRAQTEYLIEYARTLTRKNNLLTNQTDMLFWSHAKLLLANNNKQPPTFEAGNWNGNAQRIQEIRVEHEDLLTRVDGNGAWKYIDPGNKAIIHAVFENCMHEFD